MRNAFIFIELNEVNFDIARMYLDLHSTNLPNIRKLLQLLAITTSSEDGYEELEPWIQWVSVHTGKTYAEHKILRLGDISTKDTVQIFEEIESAGNVVGCISPMNASNNLTSPSYFIPDPWSGTSADGSWWSRKIASALSQAVNDNAKSKITFTSYVIILLACIRFARIAHYFKYVKLAFSSSGKPWRKALFLDLLLHDIHMSFLKNRKADFSTLFLNAGAHIQHHYLFNSKVFNNGGSLQNPTWYISKRYDPFNEMLELYDLVLGDYLSLVGVELLVATGLSQAPYDRVKYYYRLKEHESFIRSLGIDFVRVAPRMTRDFLIIFENESEARKAQSVIDSITVSGEKLFGLTDVRHCSLFVTLTYPYEIMQGSVFEYNGENRKLFPHVVFVAIKNGMHQEKGFAFFSKGIEDCAPNEGAHIKELNNSIKKYFDVT